MNWGFAKKSVCLMSAMLMLWSMAGCHGDPEAPSGGTEPEPTAAQSHGPEETTPTHSQESTTASTGEENAVLSMGYDDHMDVTGRTVEIIDAGQPISYKVACRFAGGYPG